jgi:hypothetical protein
MKTNIVMSIAFFLTCTTLVNAQSTSSGVYKTYDDYVNQKMAYAIDCKTEKHRIKLNEFPNKSFIKVIHDGKPHEIPKDSVFGYQLCDGNFVRFVNNSDYHLVEKGDVWLYRKLMAKAPKGGPEPILNFFTASGTEKPMPLTMENLRNAFPENHKFHDDLVAQFNTDKDLMVYDSFHKKTKLNHLLEMSKTK